MIGQIIWLVVMILLSDILAPSPEDQAKRGNIQSIDFPTATEGRPIPIVYGTVVLKSLNMLWYGDLKSKAVTDETGLIIKKSFVLYYEYFIGMQHGLCLGPIDSINKVWAGDKLLFDGTAVDGNEVDITKAYLWGDPDSGGTGGLSGTLAVHGGTEAQTIDSYLSPFQTVSSQQPAYRGVCYTAWRRGYVGTSTQLKAWKYEVSAIPDGLDLISVPGLTSKTVNTYDANPMNVIYDILINHLGYSPSRINVTNFQDAAKVLKTEGNGISMIIDTVQEAAKVLEVIQDQIDGIVYRNKSTGLYEISLARDDYDIDLVPELIGSNILKVSSYTRSSYEDVSNEVRISFQNRVDEYKETFAIEQNPANVSIQGGIQNSVTIKLPGVKDNALARNLAHREILARSFPLIRAKVDVDRTLYDLNPGDVIAFTWPDLGVVKLPMRVANLDYGDFTNGKITLDLFQDVFSFSEGVFTSPPPTLWEFDSLLVNAIPLADHLNIEAPAAIQHRAEREPGSSLWVAGRFQNDAATMYSVQDRDITFGISGPYIPDGKHYFFVLAGTLKNTMTLQSTSNIDVNPVDLVSDMEDSAVEVDNDTLGSDLSNLLLIGDEIIGYTNGVDAGTEYRAEDVVRGFLDTTRTTHTAGDKVWLMSSAGYLTKKFADNANIQFRLVPSGLGEPLDESSATDVNKLTSMRYDRPYPPSQIKVNDQALAWPTLGTLDHNIAGSTIDDVGINVDFIRRDYRNQNEYDATLIDGQTLRADFPADRNTEYKVKVYDSFVNPTQLICETDWISSQQFVDVNRPLFLRGTNGAITANIVLATHTRHGATGSEIEATQQPEVPLTFTSALSAYANFGSLPNAGISNSIAATQTGTHTFNLGRALTTGRVVQVRLNGGGWTTVITAPAITGTLAINITDTIEIQHDEPLTTGNTGETMIEVINPDASMLGYGVIEMD